MLDRPWQMNAYCLNVHTMKVDAAIDAALRNVAEYGDTDIFPFPFENLVFKDRHAEASGVLRTIHGDFWNWLSSYPPQTIPTLTQVGYTGFRWAICIFNPRRGALHLAEADSLILRLSGGKPKSDVYADLIAFAESNDPAIERKF